MSTKRFLSPNQITAWHPTPRRDGVDDPAESLRQALISNDLWTPSQVAGRNFAMGCVSLEVTQRCNLDCSLCYLSDMAEAVPPTIVSRCRHLTLRPGRSQLT